MKVRDLFERRGPSHGNVPVKFIWTLEWQDDAGEWQSDDVTVTGTVSYDDDPYGVGERLGSRDFEFFPKAVISGNTKQPIDINSISEEEWAKIEEYALEKAHDELESQQAEYDDWAREEQRLERF